MEVHLLHLTHYRDPTYRARLGKPNVQRYDWDKETTTIAELIFTALKHCSTCSPLWAQAFGQLHAACDDLYRDKSFAWPDHLAEPGDVHANLTGIGL
jgi:hypothetical protein